MILQAAQSAAPAADAAARPAGSGWTMWVMLALIFLVMYLFMIRPQRKQQKELQNFRSGLKKGDKIMTIGGIMGEIAEVGETDVLVKVDGDVKIRFAKDAIQNPGTPRQ